MKCVKGKMLGCFGAIWGESSECPQGIWLMHWNDYCQITLSSRELLALVQLMKNIHELSLDICNWNLWHGENLYGSPSYNYESNNFQKDNIMVRVSSDCFRWDVIAGMGTMSFTERTSYALLLCEETQWKNQKDKA